MADLTLRCVDADGYDREVFAAALARNRALAAMRDRLGNILPHAEPLLADLFAALFKMTLTVKTEAELSAAALVNRKIVRAVVQSRALKELKVRTELDPARAAVATTALAERVLQVLKRTYRFDALKLIEAADVAFDEERLDQVQSELAHLPRIDELAPEAKETLRGQLGEELAARRRELAERRREQKRFARRLDRELGDAVDGKLGRLPAELDDAEAQTQAFGLGTGGDGRVDAAKRLELGERILASRKLKLLAKLVGAFREVAFEARRRRVNRAPQELHAVTAGKDLERLLPSELLGLRPNRALRLDFLRRLAEGQLLHYRLDAPARRGPMVVCLDGSGSMRGSKELWGKAVALTLMEIARRERRRCLALVFSSGHQLFEVELLGARSHGGRARVRDEAVLRFAEYFPGGGTDFEEPLRRAVDAVASGDYRRGDVVFISDGQASVSDQLVAHVARARARHRFKVRGILVDVGAADDNALRRVADEVRTVSDLTADSMADLFQAV